MTKVPSWSMNASYYKGTESVDYVLADCLPVYIIIVMPCIIPDLGV